MTFTEVKNLRYKNMSRSKKVFRGVEFNSGEIKDVNGYINDPMMVRVDENGQVLRSSKKKSSSIPTRVDNKSEVQA